MTDDAENRSPLPSPRAHRLAIAVLALFAALVATVAGQGWPEGGRETIGLTVWPATAIILVGYGFDITRFPLPWSTKK